MTERLDTAEIDRLIRAERIWLEQARERLHRPARRTRPDASSPQTEETDR